MESASDVRASLAVVPLGELRPHEETSTVGEAAVRNLLVAARVLSWPLVVDGPSGLILDGSHRAVVLARDLGARYALVQQVELDASDVHVGTWCRVLEGVSASSFARACRAFGLRDESGDGLRCHYGGRVYTGPGADAREAHALAQALERLLSANGHPVRARLVEEDATGPWLEAADVVVLRPPAVEKGTVHRRAAGALWPPKSTRFVVPYRVVGLDVPLAMLAGTRDALAARLEEERTRPLVCLGAGLSVDRRYPERLWQFADYRIPNRLFANEAAQGAYADALAQQALGPPSPREVSGGPRHASQSCRSCPS
jgi:hypothetical protein